MPRFSVTRSYSSSHNGRLFGPWEAGSEVELDQDDADWVNRDSPGVVEPVRQHTERQEPPAADRQKRGGRNRSL